MAPIIERTKICITAAGNDCYLYAGGGDLVEAKITSFERVLTHRPFLQYVYNATDGKYYEHFHNRLGECFICPPPQCEYSGLKRRYIYANYLDGCPKCVSLVPDGHYSIRSSERGHVWNLRLDFEDNIGVDCSSRSSCGRCSVRGKCVGCNSERQRRIKLGSQGVTWWLIAPSSSKQHQTYQRSRSAPRERKALCYCMG